MMRKIIVTGGSGLLGSKVIENLGDRFEVVGVYNTNPIAMNNISAVCLDIRNEEKVSKIIKNFKPDFIIHSAAMTNVDDCEKYPEKAWEINVMGTKNVVNIASQIGAKVAYISTDYVFDGNKGLYKEEDTPNPINHYGRTKLEGELLVRSSCRNFVICRLSSLYGWNEITKKQNFAIWVIEKLRKKESVTLFEEQYTTPTFADNAARVIIELINLDKNGVYHIASPDCMSRFEFGRKLAEIFQLDKNLLKPISAATLNLPAKRPKRCCFNVSKAKRELSTKLLSTEEALIEMREQERGRR